MSKRDDVIVNKNNEYKYKVGEKIRAVKNGNCYKLSDEFVIKTAATGLTNDYVIVENLEGNSGFSMLAEELFCNFIPESFLTIIMKKLKKYLLQKKILMKFLKKPV